MPKIAVAPPYRLYSPGGGLPDVPATGVEVTVQQEADIRAKLDANPRNRIRIIEWTGDVAEVSDSSPATRMYVQQQLAELEGGLSTTFAARGVGRFLTRAQSGEALKVTVLGDSMWAGQTVTNPATDGAAILLATDISARFGNATTVTNRAMGGRTMLTMFTFSDVKNALADKADLYIIGGGRNDGQIYIGGQGGEYGPGYPRAGSIAARERLIRMIRDRVPKADIILTSEGPYRANSVNTVVLEPYYADVERLAAEYGCEFVDVYAAAKALGDYDHLIHADGVHPNTAGHRFMADVVLDHLPVEYNGPVVVPGKPARLATLKPGEVDASKGRGGYLTASSTSVTGLTFTKGGTGWAGTAPHATSTAGDYIEYAFTGTELHVNMSLSASDAVLFDVRVDGALVKTDANPRLAGSSIDSYVPVAVGLTPAAHTVRLTLKSGTLKINQATALVGPGSDLIGDAVTVLVDAKSGQSTTIDSAGGATAVIDAVTIPLPEGWLAMDVTFDGFFRCYIQGETLTKRSVKVLPKINGAIVQNYINTVEPVPASAFDWTTFTIALTHTGATAAIVFDLDAYMWSADKTQGRLEEWNIKATCRRVA